MRQAGMPYDKIAEALDYSPTGAADAVRKAMARIVDPVAEDVLWLELARLDRLLESHWEFALEGDTKATEICLSIMKRRAALLGLEKLNVDLTSGGSKISGGPMIYIPQMDELFEKPKPFDDE